MSKIITLIIKSIFTEKIIKMIVGLLGDYLVKSTKNKLDDKLWTRVKVALKI